MRGRAGRGHAPRHPHPPRMAGKTLPQACDRGRGPDAPRDRSRRQPEGGYTVTSPLLPELITEGDTLSEALANVEDAFGAVVEIYQDRGRPLPSSLYLDDANGPLTVETIVSVP